MPWCIYFSTVMSFLAVEMHCNPGMQRCRFCVRGLFSFVRACVFTVVNSEDYYSGLRLCVWGPALCGYMSLSTPPWTCRERVSSCMWLGQSRAGHLTFSRKLAGARLGLRVSPHKQTVTVCTQGECYQAVIISVAVIGPPNRSQGEKKSFIISISEHTSH